MVNEKMKRLAIVMMLMIPCTVLADGYDDYKQKMMEYYGVRLSFPEKMIDETVFKFANEVEFRDNSFSFADIKESGGNIPSFEGGLFIRLDEGCYVIMGGLSHAEKPRPEQFPPIDENTIKHHRSAFDGRMLNNCGLPWFHIDHDPSVLNNVELMKKIEDARSKYVRTFADGELVFPTNSDRAYIVQIPYLDKIFCGIDYLVRDSATIVSGKHSNIEALNREKWGKCDKCFGIDFYRADRYMSVSMLVFIDSIHTTWSIGQYADLLSRYICFVPKFKL